MAFKSHFFLRKINSDALKFLQRGGGDDCAYGSMMAILDAHTEPSDAHMRCLMQQQKSRENHVKKKMS
jgi:hypothetical protein